jgi:hypothetical protein
MPLLLLELLLLYWLGCISTYPCYGRSPSNRGQPLEPDLLGTCRRDSEKRVNRFMFNEEVTMHWAT